jgi:predicted ferric reductase
MPFSFSTFGATGILIVIGLLVIAELGKKIYHQFRS